MNLSSSICTADELIGGVKAAMQFFEKKDFPLRVRASPTLYYMLRDRLPPSLFQPESILSGFNIAGLPCELDFELPRYLAEVDYRSGKVEKLNFAQGEAKQCPS